MVGEGLISATPQPLCPKERAPSPIVQDPRAGLDGYGEKKVS